MEWDSYKESPIYDAESYMTALKKRYLECYTSHSCYLTGSNISRSNPPAQSPRLAGTEENVVLEKEPSFRSDFRGLRRRSYEMMIAFSGEGQGVDKSKDKTPTPMFSPGEVFLNSEVMSPEICNTPTEVSPGVIASSPPPMNASPDLDDRSSPVSFTTSPPQHLVSPAPYFDSNKIAPPKLVVQRRALPHITFSPRGTLTSEEDGSAKFSGYTTPSGSVFDSPEPQLKHQPDLGSVQSAQRAFSSALMGCSQLSPMVNSTNLSSKPSPNPFSKVKYKENASDVSVLNQSRGMCKDNRRKIRPLSAYQYFKKSHNVDFSGSHQRSKSIDDSKSKYTLSNHQMNSKSDHVPKLSRAKWSPSTKPNKFNRSWTSSSDYNIVPEKEKSLTRSKSCCSARGNAISTGVGRGRNYRGKESKHRVFRLDGDCRVLFPNFTVSHS